MQSWDNTAVFLYIIKLGRFRQGFEKQRQSQRRFGKPITDQILAKMLIFLDPSDYVHQTLRSLLLFVKFGLLQVSECSCGKGANAPKVKQI